MDAGDGDSSLVVDGEVSFVQHSHKKHSRQLSLVGGGDGDTIYVDDNDVIVSQSPKKSKSKIGRTAGSSQENSADVCASSKKKTHAEHLQEGPAKVKSSVRKQKKVDNVVNDDGMQEGLLSEVVTNKDRKSKNKKRKHDIEVVEDSGKHKRRRTESEVSVTQQEDLNVSNSSDHQQAVFNLVQVIDGPGDAAAKMLLNRMLEALPPDTAHQSYRTTLEKIDWEAVQFDKFTADQCRTIWNCIARRIRKERSLQELIAEAQNTDLLAWTKHHLRNPERPKKPMTAYFRFCCDKRASLLQRNPGLSNSEVRQKLIHKYKKLSAAQRKKYDDAYAAEKKIYDANMEKYYHENPNWDDRRHPEAFTVPISVTQYFSYHHLQKKRAKADDPKKLDRKSILMQYRNKWNAMTKEQKVKFIRKTLKQNDEYKRKVEAGEMKEDPMHRSIKLSKAEQALLDESDGKMKKPPINGYALFCMKYSKKHLNNKSLGERTKICAQKWQEFSSDKKNHYIRKAAKQHEKYCEYLKGLGIEPPQKKTAVVSDKSRRKKKNMFEGEPVKPLTPVAQFFKEVCQNPQIPTKQRPLEVSRQWAALSMAHKAQRKADYDNAMLEYYHKLDDFKKGLTPEQLNAYLDARKRKKYTRHKPAEGEKTEEMATDADKKSGKKKAAQKTADTEGDELSSPSKRKKPGKKNAAQKTADTNGNELSSPSKKKKSGKKNAAQKTADTDGTELSSPSKKKKSGNKSAALEITGTEKNVFSSPSKRNHSEMQIVAHLAADEEDTELFSPSKKKSDKPNVAQKSSGLENESSPSKKKSKQQMDVPEEASDVDNSEVLISSSDEEPETNQLAKKKKKTR